MARNSKSVAGRGRVRPLPRRRRACAARPPGVRNGDRCGVRFAAQSGPKRRSLAAGRGRPRPPPGATLLTCRARRDALPPSVPAAARHGTARVGRGGCGAGGRLGRPPPTPAARPVRAPDARPKNHAGTAHNVQILAFAPPYGQKTPQTGVKCPWRRLSGRYGRCVHHRYILLFGAW